MYHVNWIYCTMKNDTLAKTINLDDILSLNMQSDTAIPLTESVEMQSDNMRDASVDWDTIIAEWFYRLPNGYAKKPYTESELLVLEQVMHEYSDYYVLNNLAENFLNEISIDLITNKALIDVIEAKRKNEDFQEFLSYIPGGIPSNTMINFLNKLSKQESKEFADKLYSETTIESLTPSMYASGIGQKIFELKPEGMGKGEFFIAWLVRSAQNSGGGESFDVRLKGKKYEVKDYRPDDSSGIRLGTKGKVTRFKFWYHIIDTIDYINKIFDIDPKFAILGAAAGPAKIIHENGSFIKGGEFSGETKLTFQSFYELMHEDFSSDSNGYTMITLRGANIKPVSFSIEELPDVSGNSLKIKLTSDAMSPNDNKLIVMSNKLKYVRTPELFNNDLQDIVNELVGTLPFIVFRKSQINITNSFKYKSISQGTVYIIEASLADKEKKPRTSKQKKG